MLFIFLYCIFLKTKNRVIKIQQYRQKTHFVSGANTYMFRHPGAIIRELFQLQNFECPTVFQARAACTAVCNQSDLRLEYFRSYETLLLKNSLMMEPWCRNM